MGQLTTEQLERLREFLTNQNLTFKPLLDELVDHISCDLEDRLSQGISFEQAWEQSINDLPNNHFHILQKQTMETINKQFTASRITSYLSLISLFASLIFKVQHLQFGDRLLLLSFIMLASSLLIGSLSGIYFNKEKKGAIRVLTVVTGVLILLVGYAFKILHFPGAGGIILVAITALIVSMIVNTFYVYKRASGEGNLLTYLHEMYTPGIERFLLILLLLLTIYKVIFVSNQVNDFIGNIILILVIFGGGLQFIALSWRAMEKDLKNHTSINLAALIVSFSTLMLLFLGNYIPYDIRVVLVTLFTVVSGWLAYRIDTESNKAISLVMACMASVIFFAWMLIKLNIISVNLNTIIFNIPIVIILMAGLFLCRKHEAMRTYLIIILSSYLLEYSYT